VCGGVGWLGGGETIKYIWYASRIKSIFVEWLTMDTNIDSSSFIPDPTSLYNMRVGELLKEDLGHMRKGLEVFFFKF